MYNGKKCINCQKKLKVREYKMNICQDCQFWKANHPLPLVKNTALFYYNDFGHEFIERAKFQGDIVLWESVALLIRMFGLLEGRYIQRIPSSEATYKARDFDHLDYLLNPVRRKSVSIVEKAPNIISQIRLSDVQERRKLKSGFRIISENAINQVILFDDVYTTGSTLKDCQVILEKSDIKVQKTITLFRSDLR